MATGSTLENEIAGYLKESLEREAAKAFDQYKKEAVEKFAQEIEDKRDELLAKMSLRVFKNIEIGRMGETITISVRKEN